MDVNSKLMCRPSVNLRLEMINLKRSLASTATLIWILVSRLSCETVRKNLSALFATRVKHKASESMLPNKLKRHLTSSHPKFASKPRNFFA